MKSKGAHQKSQKHQQVMNLSEDQARAHIERIRWPEGPACVHCGSINVYRMEGRSIRAGLLACRDCRGHFTVTVGTVMEDSHLPLATWLRAFHLMATSKKGMSALQLQRNLGLGSYRTAWHLAHRIREAMRCDPVAGKLKGTVEVDEVFLGPQQKRSSERMNRKKIVVALIERDGDAKVPPVPNTGGKVLKDIVRANCEPGAMIYSDGYSSYKGLDKDFAGHETVNHTAGEYARGDVHINNCESFFGLMRRGVIGTFHHISSEHAPRYANEFAFRWNRRKWSDTARRDAAIRGIEDKQLTYKDTITH